ncbi:MAG TPA: acylneuraminate cytidylyltransferase family protein, partial [Blastocatellia bacterium]
MNILGLIPARGGSKGVPRKNIKLLAGKPLLNYTAEAALSSKRLTRVILSTEDEEIAEVGRTCGI